MKEKIREIFLKVLAFLLGFKHESYAVMAIKGGELLRKQLLQELEPLIDTKQIYGITTVGAIAYSDEVEDIKMRLNKGEEVAFSYPKEFDGLADYIDFYQVESIDNSCYILARSNMASIGDNGKIFFFIKINHKYNTSTSLPSAKIY